MGREGMISRLPRGNRFCSSIPTQTDALAALATFYQSNGDTTLANHYLALLRKAKPGDARIAQIPSASARPGNTSDFEAAAKLASQHRYQESLELYRKAFHGTEPSGMWAVSYYETEAAVPAELPQAITGLRGLAKEYPANPGYQLALGRVLTYDPKTRVEGIRSAGQRSRNRGSNRAGQTRLAPGNLWDVNGPAAETAKEYLSRYPDDQLEAKLHTAQAEHTSHAPVPGQSEQGEAYAALHKGDLTQAQQLFVPLLSIPGQRGKALAGLGYVNMQQQNFAAAADHFEQAQQAGFDAPELTAALTEARYWKAMQAGNHALAENDVTHAMSAFEQAHTLKPALLKRCKAKPGYGCCKINPRKLSPLRAGSQNAGGPAPGLDRLVRRAGAIR